MKPILVYVAGPYSLGNKKANAEFAIAAGDVLFRNGVIPYIPHLTHYWGQIAPHSWSEWLAYDEEWLKLCTYILRLTGPSAGSDRECRLAEELGIPIFYNLVDLFNHIKRPWGVLSERIDRENSNK